MFLTDYPLVKFPKIWLHSEAMILFIMFSFLFFFTQNNPSPSNPCISPFQVQKLNRDVEEGDLKGWIEGGGEEREREQDHNHTGDSL